MDKAQQRKEALALRRAMGAQRRAQADAALCSRLAELVPHKVIFSYLSMEEEADLSAFHRWAWAQGFTLAFPVTGAGGQMEAYVPASLDGWALDRYGIRIPNPAHSRRLDPLELELVLTPCVAFDEAACRLGHGGGYYDRYFVRCLQAFRLGIAYEAQKLPEITCSAHDVPLHAVLTESAYYPWK